MVSQSRASHYPRAWVAIWVALESLKRLAGHWVTRKGNLKEREKQYEVAKGEEIYSVPGIAKGG